MMSNRGALEVLTVLVQVNDASIQGPDEGDVQRVVM